MKNALRAIAFAAVTLGACETRPLVQADEICIQSDPASDEDAKKKIFETIYEIAQKYDVAMCDNEEQIKRQIPVSVRANNAENGVIRGEISSKLIAPFSRVYVWDDRKGCETRPFSISHGSDFHSTRVALDYTLDCLLKDTHELFWTYGATSADVYKSSPRHLTRE